MFAGLAAISRTERVIVADEAAVWHTDEAAAKFLKSKNLCWLTVHINFFSTAK